jgi:competence ComEA-like helix-hairpin-helix protein
VKKKSIFSQLQSFFGISRAELIFVIVILSGLILGLCVKILRGGDENSINNSEVAALIYNTLDSLADAEAKLYTGSSLDPSDAQIIDTSQSSFSHSKKKELPKYKININNATQSELMLLPMVGRTTAQKIIDYRKLHPFKSPTDLLKVEGIGRKKLKSILPYIKVD